MRFVSLAAVVLLGGCASLVGADFGRSAVDASADADSPPDAGGDRGEASEASVDAVAPDAVDASCVTSAPPLANGPIVSNPPAVVTQTATGYVLRKDLNAFGNYGVVDGRADILYSGQSASWTFEVPQAPISSATLAISIVADDVSQGPTYGFRTWAGACVYDNASTQLPHGAPAASRFSNWLEVTYPANISPGNIFTMSIENTTTYTGAWLAIDWLELRVATH
jgi:hypothetical protein